MLYIGNDALCLPHIAILLQLHYALLSILSEPFLLLSLFIIYFMHFAIIYTIDFTSRHELDAYSD
jgi:hypothetical protein